LQRQSWHWHTHSDKTPPPGWRVAACASLLLLSRTSRCEQVQPEATLPEQGHPEATWQQLLVAAPLICAVAP
jgi:hypothetical protein